MARRSTAFDYLVRLPWWVNVLLSVLVYVGLDRGLEMVAFNSVVFQSFATVFSSMAGYLSGLFVLMAGLSAINAYRKRKLLKTRTDILSIRQLSWAQFETLTGEYFRQQGYAVIENTKSGADGGVDVRLKRHGETTLVQCKNWRANKVGVATVRELLGTVTAERATRGIVVCSGHFTGAAKNFAKGTCIDLIDGEALLAQIRASQKTAPTITPTIETLSCPLCQSAMVERRATKGKNAGTSFFGCSTYPKCRGTLASSK